MRRFPLAFVVSVLLHVGLLLLAYISWTNMPKPVPVVSVPVELVSKIPSRQQAEAPVDKLAVKPPQPIPAPEEKPQPTPPTPAPPLPVPVPQKEVVPQKKPEPKPEPKPKPPEPRPQPKPEPKPAEKAPPDKNGLKKPVPPEKAKPAPAKPALDLNALAQTAASPSRAPTRTLAQANTHRTTGMSNVGSGPADAGDKTNNAEEELGRRLQGLWNPMCGVAGANKVVLKVRVWPSHGGRILRQPQWDNPSGDSMASAAFGRAQAAVAQVDISDLNFPPDDYTGGIEVNFNAPKACKGQ
jgi:outer membrane biosynthesis protein TonB